MRVTIESAGKIITISGVPDSFFPEFLRNWFEHTTKHQKLLEDEE